MMSANDVVMLDVRSAAALASRTPETIRRWVWSGRLPARRQGRRLLVARDDVLRLSEGGADLPAELTLAEWADEVMAGRVGAAATASDLVLSDRGLRDVPAPDISAR